MSEVGTILVSIVGGSLGGAVLGAWQAARIRSTTRRGRARLVHEDLYRLQATVTRLYYETNQERESGRPEWLLMLLADTGDQQDVVADLKSDYFGECAAALGWSEFLRRGYDEDAKGPSDAQLREIYERLACGRFAVGKLAKLDYRPHNPAFVDRSAWRRNHDCPLRCLSEGDVERLIEERRRS